MLEAIWRVLLELAPWLLFGTVVAGLLHVVLPRDLIRSQLTGWLGPLKAVMIGVPMPLCSCGVIPAGLGLKKDGASDGSAVGFLISTPQTGVDSILVSASFLGWPFALFKVVSATVTGLAGGWLTDRFGGSSDSAAELESDQATDKRGLAQGWAHGRMLLHSIWRWLLFGVVVSAAIEVLVPEQTMAGLAVLGSLGAALAVLVISLPLYVCATASVPIAAALVANGMPTGAALVFLMAGPASNVATIGAIYRGFGLRTLLIYLATVGLGSIGFGVLFDSVIESGAVGGMAHGGPAAWWAVASAVLLLALLTRFAWQDLRSWWSRRRTRQESVGELHEVAVEGMTCNGCVNTLEQALAGADGVTAVEVTLKPGRAAVRGPIDEQSLHQVIRDAGFQPG